jgi:uncharacterized surface protein with fasciclin (FAS1) repeats
VDNSQNGCQGTHSESLEPYLGGSDGVKVNEAKVIKVDIEADNDVSHEIDTVLVPYQQ